jgi:glycosyltransferase involved in cell wall biosynthesis
MSMTPLVTVITAAYDAAPFVEEAIGSVLAQVDAAFDFEYLVVDDGSSDATAPLAGAALKATSEARLIRTEHRGQAAARNRGLADARGEYVAFLDADDVWEPTMLARSVAALRAAPADVAAVFCHSLLIDAAGAVIGRLSPRAGFHDLGDLLAGACPPGNGSCLLLRRRAFDEAGGFDETMQVSVDFEMWLRIAATTSFGRFWCFPEQLVRYRRHPASITGIDRLALSTPARLEALASLLRRYADAVASPEQRVGAFAIAAMLAFEGGDEVRGVSWMREAMRLGPRSLTQVHSVGRRLLVWRAAGPVGRRLWRARKRLKRRGRG